MTQNLDFDLASWAGTYEVTLSAETSDVPSNFPKITVTRYDNATGVGSWGEDNAALKYYNPGLYVYTQLTKGNNCGAVVNFSDCTGYGWKEYEVGDDEHYLVGNHYSWAAATAGTGNNATTANANAASSICPYGWKLPYSGSIYNNTSGSFRNLLNNYEFKFNADGILMGSLISNTGQNITVAPLYFLRSGTITATSLGNAGYGGTYWSRTTNSDNVYILSFADNINPVASYLRYLGLSIRCLVI